MKQPTKEEIICAIRFFFKLAAVDVDKASYYALRGQEIQNYWKEKGAF